MTLQCPLMTAGRKRSIPLAGLYVILDPTVRPDRPLLEVLEAAAASGVRIFQYRNKTASMKQAYDEAGRLGSRARDLDVLFLVNDRCDLALAIDADGVHLGQTDLPYGHARHLLGPDKYIGISTHTAAQVKEADRLGPDYIGFGPIYTPASKVDHERVVGLHGLRAIRPLTSLPLFAIGGIQADHVRPLIDAGADGIAVISAVVGAADVAGAAARFTGQLL
jgi:thiamine-phosphate pyrophosphorylase